MIKALYNPQIPFPLPSIARERGRALYTFFAKSKRGALGEAQKPAKVGSPFLTQAVSPQRETLGSAPLRSAKKQAQAKAPSLGDHLGSSPARRLLAGILGVPVLPRWKTIGKGRKGIPTQGIQPARLSLEMLFDKESPIPAL